MAKVSGSRRKPTKAQVREACLYMLEWLGRHWANQPKPAQQPKRRRK